MTVCNMSIEAGARAGLIAPDETTFAYVKGRRDRAEGRGMGGGGRLLEDAALRPGRRLRHRDHARRARDRSAGHLGHPPAGRAADHRRRAEPGRRGGRGASAPRSSARSSTWASKPGTQLQDVKVDRVFIGSCTNAPHRGSARRGEDRQGPQGRRPRQGDGRARLRPGEAPGGGGRPRQDLPRRRLRVARARLLDVPRP